MPDLNKTRENLILSQLDYADNMAKKYSRIKNVYNYLPDLIGAARLGLVEASYSYNFEYGPTSFKTFMYRRILGSVIDEYGFLMWGKRNSPNKRREDPTLRRFNFPPMIYEINERLATLNNLEKTHRKLDVLYLLSNTKDLKRTETKVLMGILQGRSQVEISKEIKCTAGNITHLIKNIIKKFRENIK